MKFVRILRNGKGVWGILDGENVRTLTKAPYEEISYDGESCPLSSCRLLAPSEPSKFVCVGKNYSDHIKELRTMKTTAETPEQPTLFMKGPNSINHPEGELHAPGFVKRLDYEGELGIVIKRRAKDVKAKDFADYVLGYTCLNDVTARDIQQTDGQWTRGKCMDGFMPFGPVVSDELDPLRATVETRLNGKVVQKGSTDDMITGVPELIEFITAAMTLEPGDVVATGTPAGVGPMTPGDVVEVEIKGIGVLKNHVV